MKVIIWNHTRKPKTIEGEIGQELGIALTGSQRVGHGTLSKNDNANMDAIKENGGHIIEKNGNVYVAFNHFEEFEEDIGSMPASNKEEHETY